MIRSMIQNWLPYRIKNATVSYPLPANMGLFSVGGCGPKRASGPWRLGAESWSFKSVLVGS
jgi:hypothetical protein